MTILEKHFCSELTGILAVGVKLPFKVKQRTIQKLALAATGSVHCHKIIGMMITLAA